MKRTFLLSCLGIAAIVSCSAKYEDGMYAEFQTAKGKIIAKLFYEQAPMTVCNFVGLAEGKIKSNRTGVKGFFDGLIFHRVVPDFVVQGGDPQGNGMGDPGYKFPDEFHLSLRHNSGGILSMANSGPNSNGSQFFITLKETPWLDNRHAIFGKVVEGMDVVKKIAQGDTIQKVTIVREGRGAKKFKADQAAFEGHIQAAKDKVAAEQKKVEAQNLAEIQKRWPNRQTTASGLMFVITKPGAGPKPAAGTPIKAHYTGTLMDGTKFDSSLDRGTPFDFTVGQGMVIKGWDEAFMDMQKGEKRTLIIPPALGYGERGAGSVIPPNAYLVFEVELVDFK